MSQYFGLVLLFLKNLIKKTFLKNLEKKSTKKKFN